MRHAPRSHFSLQQGKCRAGRPTLSSHESRNERLQAESDDMHVPPQNAISIYLQFSLHILCSFYG